MEDWKKRQDWNYWINEARKEADNSTCLRMKFGAVIITENIGGLLTEPEVYIIGKGSNQQPYEKCETCIREENNIPPRTRREFCYAVHAEENAIHDALRSKQSLNDAVLIVAGYNPKTGDVTYNRFSCTTCANTMAAAGLAGMVAKTPEGPRFRTIREAHAEAYAVLKDIDSTKLNTEKDLQELLLKRK